MSIRLPFLRRKATQNELDRAAVLKAKIRAKGKVQKGDTLDTIFHKSTGKIEVIHTRATSNFKRKRKKIFRNRIA